MNIRSFLLAGTVIPLMALTAWPAAAEVPSLQLAQAQPDGDQRARPPRANQPAAKPDATKPPQKPETTKPQQPARPQRPNTPAASGADTPPRAPAATRPATPERTTPTTPQRSQSPAGAGQSQQNTTTPAQPRAGTPATPTRPQAPAVQPVERSGNQPAGRSGAGARPDNRDGNDNRTQSNERGRSNDSGRTEERGRSNDSGRPNDSGRSDDRNRAGERGPGDRNQAGDNNRNQPGDNNRNRADDNRNQSGDNNRNRGDDNNRGRADDNNRNRADDNNRAHRLDDVRSSRRETKEGNRTIIHEGGRTIVREGDRVIIRQDQTDRFRRNARDVQVVKRGRETTTTIVQRDGSRIVTIVDDNGRLLRRIRRDPRGRDIILIDNGPIRGPGLGLPALIALAPLALTIPREQYIVETERANPTMIYDTLLAPPVERIDRRYTLDEIVSNAPVRDRMRRIDINTITFETGSWDVGPEFANRLDGIATAMKRAIQANPAEMFLIEGHTDAVGDDVDNLSLSDRRAESVAQVLSDQFQVPAENLTTQGYGEQNLKVPTDGPEKENRRVTVRRITPLLTGQAGAAPR